MIFGVCVWKLETKSTVQNLNLVRTCASSYMFFDFIDYFVICSPILRYTRKNTVRHFHLSIHEEITPNLVLLRQTRPYTQMIEQNRFFTYFAFIHLSCWRGVGPKFHYHKSLSAHITPLSYSIIILAVFNQYLCDSGTLEKKTGYGPTDRWTDTSGKASVKLSYLAFFQDVQELSPKINTLANMTKVQKYAMQLQKLKMVKFRELISQLQVLS